MCGVTGLYNLNGENKQNLGLLQLGILEGNKHRGQDGYGVSILSRTGRIDTYKFDDAFNEDVRKTISGASEEALATIAHARYPTSGSVDSSDRNMQPFEIKEVALGVSFAFNGNIVNAYELGEQLIAENKLSGDASLSFSDPLLDTDVLKALIHLRIKNGETDIRRIMEYIQDRIDGACNIILMGADGSFGFSKDRWGIRPLAYEIKDGILRVSSEDSALFKVGGDEPTFVNTGEYVEVNPHTKDVLAGNMKLTHPISKSRCFFETVYFAHWRTKMWGTESSTHRYRLGQELAKEEPEGLFSRDSTVVLDVPASSENSAEGYSDTTRLPWVKGAITKKPLSNRTFIGDEFTREQKIRDKYILNPSLKPFIKGKKLILIDDSIVRGGTMEHLVKYLQEFYEPSEIHIRIPSPPIISPCFYAINLKSVDELLARRFFDDVTSPRDDELNNLAQYLGSSSINYLGVPGLINALRVDIKDMCLGCVTGKYPTPGGQQNYEMQLASFEEMKGKIKK